MKRSCFLLLLLLLFCGSVVAQQVQQQREIVYIDGVKWHLHTVREGETAYSIAKAYGTSVESLLEANPSARDGLKIDQTLRLPVAQTQTSAEMMSDKKLRKSFLLHTISEGETLYSISRKYEISVATIVEDNEGIDPLSLTVGQSLKIRKKSIGRSDEEQAQEQMAQIVATLGGAPAGYDYYVVKPRETVYSLSRRYGMTESEFVQLNNLPDGLKAGAVILVPSDKADDVQTQPRVDSVHVEPSDSTLILLPADSVTVEEVELQEPMRFKSLGSQQRLKVALLLPLSDNGQVKATYRAMYQGFLLGLEDVKRHGYSVDLLLFDTQRKTEAVDKIVGGDALSGVNLIVGHLYPDEVSPVVEYADSCNIPFVSPFHDMAAHDSRVVFQMAPSDNSKYDKLRPLLDSGALVTVIRTTKVDSLYEKEVINFLTRNNVAYENYQFRGAQGADFAKQGDLTPLLKKSSSHLFFVLSDNEVETDRVLASLSSAQSNILARTGSNPKVVTIGNAKWGRYANIDRVNFFKNNVTYVAPFYASRSSRVVRNFDSRYIKAFGSMPSQYSYRGYETAVIFCEGIFSDIETDMQSRHYSPLQSVYRFGKEQGSQISVNQEWMLIRYDSSLSVVVE